MMMPDNGSGTATRSAGATGCRATWQWTHSKGSAATNGSTPVSIWYKVTPKEYRSLRVSIRSIHAPGLFGRHVGKGTGNDFGRRRRRRLALAGQPGRDAKAG